MKRSLFVLGVTILIAVVASSTASARTSAAAFKPTATSGARPVIGYINLSDRIPFVVLVRKSIERAAKANGAILRQCNPDLDAQKAINCARQLKQQKVQGIINFQLHESAAPRVCSAGPKVPVVSIDIHQRPCEIVFFGANNFFAGKLAGTAIGQFAKRRWNCQIDAYVDLNAFQAGEVVLIRGRGLLAGYESVCGKLSSRGLSRIKVDGKATTDGAIQPMRDTLQTLPGKSRIVVVSTNDDMIIGAIRAAESLGRGGDIYVAGQGADPTSFPYICGKRDFKNWVGDTAYFPERYGDEVVPLLLSLIDGLPQPKTVYTPHRVVTPQNIKAIYPNACRG